MNSFLFSSFSSTIVAKTSANIKPISLPTKPSDFVGTQRYTLIQGLKKKRFHGTYLGFDTHPLKEESSILHRESVLWILPLNDYIP